METAVEREALLPCPFCGCDLVPNTNQADMMVRRYGTHYDHPQSLCHLSEHEVRPIEVEDWNLRAAPPIAPGEREALDKLRGAMRFVLAFYEPGQTHLDTNAWKNAEASARAALKVADAAIAAKAQAPAEPATPISKTNADYWLSIRANVIDALAAEGLEIWSDKGRVWVPWVRPKAPAENTSATEGARADAAVLLGKEIEELIATEFGITGGTIHSKVNKLVVLAAGKAPAQPAAEALGSDQQAKEHACLRAVYEAARLVIQSHCHPVTVAELSKAIEALKAGKP